MGVLTSDMRRLRGQIDAAHGERESLMHNLARGTSQLKRDVGTMLTGFQAANLQMARRTHNECASFLAGVDKAVNHIRFTVAGLRKEFASDIQGARRAWDGGGAPRKAKTAARHGAGGRSKHT